jgi:secreted trypsin-like serine protease
VPLLRFNEDPVTTFGTSCSGALVTRFHIVTAAHCVTDANGVFDVDLVSTNNYVLFPTPPAANPFAGALQQVAVSSIIVHPGWTGDFLFGGNDIAIVRLAGAAPDEVPDYELYTGSGELGEIGTKVGWGQIGTGGTGVPIGSGWRTGQNVWEMDAKAFWDGIAVASDSILMYDFDNGLAANDAFGVYFGQSDLGLGDMEVMSGQGDSGGPTFIDGQLAGITSFGLTFTDAAGGVCLPGNPDLVCRLNSSFGEFAGDTRVSAFADWIRANTVAAPATLPMLALGLLAISSVGSLRSLSSRSQRSPRMVKRRNSRYA